MTVIGPIDQQTWNTMVLLKATIRYDKEHPTNEIQKASTDWLMEDYKYYLNKVTA